MIIFTLRDLGKGFNPWNLNNKNDVVGHQQPEEFRVVFGDGTVTALPPETTIAQDISDDGVVLVTLGSAQPALVEIATSTVEPISIPGFPALQVNALSYKGDLVGSAGRSQFITDDWRGFVMNGKTKAITWIFPMMVPLPPGATPFLELSDLNNKGRASGRQGWVRTRASRSADLLQRNNYRPDRRPRLHLQCRPHHRKRPDSSLVSPCACARLRGSLRRRNGSIVAVPQRINTGCQHVRVDIVEGHQCKLGLLPHKRNDKKIGPTSTCGLWLVQPLSDPHER